MRVIDLYLDDSSAHDILDKARELGQPAITYKVDGHTGVRIVVTDGSPDELLQDLRAQIEADPDADNFYLVSESLAMVPRPEPEEPEESRAATDEIESFVEEGAQFTKTFVILSVISGILATAGLIKDSPAVLVGAMVLAPLFKPIASIGAGIVLGRVREALRGAILLAGALAMAAAAGALVTLVTPGANATHAVEARTGVSPFDLVIALATGVAMAYTLIRRDSISMVGIVVAASLMPVASALGVAVALWNLTLIGGACVTLASSVSGMLIGLIATCKVEQLRTSDRKERRLGRQLSSRALWAGIGVVVALLGINVWVLFFTNGPRLEPAQLQQLAEADDRLVAAASTPDQRSVILYVDASVEKDAYTDLAQDAARELNVTPDRIVLTTGVRLPESPSDAPD